MISVSVNNGLIDGWNPNDLSGNTGWIYIDAEMPDVITDVNGIALYKYVDGIFVRRTDAEIEAEALANAPDVEEQPKSAEERIAELEDMLSALLSGVTE